jgi:hypothetical protein
LAKGSWQRAVGKGQLAKSSWQRAKEQFNNLTIKQLKLWQRLKAVIL